MNLKLLLHTCCADCALKTLSSLEKDYNVTLYYNNPNIHPRSEYLARLDALKKAIELYEKDVKLIISDWSPKLYFEKVKKASGRCSICWDLRIKMLFEYAKANNYDAVSTTLLSSKYQDIEVIKRIGNIYENKYGIEFITPEICQDCEKTFGFYKQNYCGCIYSLMEKYEEKYKVT